MMNVHTYIRTWSDWNIYFTVPPSLKVRISSDSEFTVPHDKLFQLLLFTLAPGWACFADAVRTGMLPALKFSLKYDCC